MSSSIRLNKALAAAGICSRRRADDLIIMGLVTVNGMLVSELGCKIDTAKDRVTVDGKPVFFDPVEIQEFTYIMLHKPIQVVSTSNDPEGRKTVLDILPSHFRQKRLYPVGRLDFFSEGLLLLTDDGELTHRLTHPKFHLPKVYHIKLREIPTEQQLIELRKGMVLNDGTQLAPVEAELSRHDDTLLVLTLHQGVNRQIRRMCKDMSLTILWLKRVQIGQLYLGSLAKGSARELSQRESIMLKTLVGLT